MKSYKTVGFLLVVLAICGCRPPSNDRQLVTRVGVLEFRIAPTLPGMTNEKTLALTKTEYETYLNRLADQDPTTRSGQDEKYLWFPIRNTCRMLAPGLIVSERGDKKYILLYNQPGYTILNDTRNPSWSVLSANSTRDERGKPEIGFNLDKRGARLLGLLTGTHKDHFLAVLVGDEVYSVPVIKSTVHSSGVIGGNFTAQEVDKLIRILKTGSRPSDTTNATVTGTGLYVRSSPSSKEGAVCDKVDRPLRITVVGRDGKYWKILPTPGCRCFISKVLVRSDNKGEIGTVLGDRVCVRVGRNGKAGKVVGRANRGDNVRILAESGDYYVIAPPKGIYFYVSTNHIKGDPPARKSSP